MIFGSFFNRAKSITADEVRTLIKEKSTDQYCLLDVRQPGEYEQGHIPGARLIPLAELPSKLNQVKSDVMTIVYCRSGNRSRSGVGILNGAGLDNVYNMEGGILAYNGLVAAGPPEAGVFCFPENMSPQELIAMAWYIEDGTQTFFDAIKAMNPDPDLTSILTSLVEHKLAHKKSLAQLYQQISGQPTKDNFPNSVLNKPPQNVMAGCVSVPEAVQWAKDKEMADILDLMMALEANTLDVYLKVGRQVASDRAKSTFIKLSKEEVRHLEQLASVFERSL